MSDNKIPLVLQYRPVINYKENLFSIYEGCFLDLYKNNTKIENFQDNLTNCLSQKAYIFNKVKEEINNNTKPIEVPNILPEGGDDEDDEDDDDDDW